MRASTLVARRWDTREYVQIEMVRYLAPDLVVGFADGTVARAAVDRFANAHLLAQRPDWSRARMGDDEVRVPGTGEVVGIPWDWIRRLTDPEFAAYWEERVGEEAVRIGRRLRYRREERGVTLPEFSKWVGETVETVSDLGGGPSPGRFGCRPSSPEGDGADPRRALGPRRALQREDARGFSELMQEVFGEARGHARSAVGMQRLPDKAPAEVKTTFEIG